MKTHNLYAAYAVVLGGYIPVGLFGSWQEADTACRQHSTRLNLPYDFPATWEHGGDVWIASVYRIRPLT